MSKRLIVNADDFGMSRGQNYGIIESHCNGIVTSTTAMVNSPWVQHAAGLSQQNPQLGVGLHFVLTWGCPLSAMNSLVNPQGEFGKWLWDYAESGRLNEDEITAELDAQFSKFVEVFGHSPTHIDSHHFVHMLPQIYPLVEDFAKKHSLPLRLDRFDVARFNIKLDDPRSTDYFDASFFGNDISEDLFLQILDKAEQRGDNSLEVMCHPAFVDPVLQKSSYCDQRAKEIDVLTSPLLMQEIISRRYTLVNYSSL